MPTNLMAQGISPQLEFIQSTLVRSFETNMPGWKHHPSEAIKGSYDVSADVWRFGKQSIYVRIARSPSAEKAATGIRDFARRMEASQENVEGADDAYSRTSFSGAASSLFFRRREFIVYLDVRCLDPEEQKQVVQISERLILDAIDGR